VCVCVALRCGVHATNLNPSSIHRSHASTIHPSIHPSRHSSPKTHRPMPHHPLPPHPIPFRVAPRRRLHCPSRTHRLARLSVLPNPAAPPSSPRSCATPRTHPTSPVQGLALILSSGCLGSRSCLFGPFVPFLPTITRPCWGRAKATRRGRLPVACLLACLLARVMPWLLAGCATALETPCSQSRGWSCCASPLLLLVCVNACLPLPWLADRTNIITDFP
jgi:hypothetical protein